MSRWPISSTWLASVAPADQQRTVRMGWLLTPDGRATGEVVPPVTW
ncbi:hypothetical protein [Amycolatopsis methanolica]|uniref:Uncharacterized protein n=1 Tax=Amycolatopsis methanolica 239 TaxID=1068978 RepID=A0A076MSF8_AMYME|nr:hypothetical protein [Amycolatopsis methanolica]AIJ23823.1 hypothetical protein AMETH_3731 [Amycolatopsis methanolica 239]